MLLPVRPSTHRRRTVAISAVAAAVLVVPATAAAGYAAAASKPLKVLSTVCVNKSGAVVVPRKGACAKGATLQRLASPIAGKTGPAGPAGSPGRPGSNGLLTTTTVSVPIDVPTSGLFTDSAHCAPGAVATGGGYELGGYDPKVTVAMSKPDLSVGTQVATGWVVRVYNQSAASIHVTIYALCAVPAES